MAVMMWLASARMSTLNRDLLKRKAKRLSAPVDPAAAESVEGETIMIGRPPSVATSVMPLSHEASQIVTASVGMSFIKIHAMSDQEFCKLYAEWAKAMQHVNNLDAVVRHSTATAGFSLAGLPLGYRRLTCICRVPVCPSRLSRCKNACSRSERERCTCRFPPRPQPTKVKCRRKSRFRADLKA